MRGRFFNPLLKLRDSKGVAAGAAGTFIKFDKIWLFFDFSGAARRSVYLGKSTA
jgi:hypothetical protein